MFLEGTVIEGQIVWDETPQLPDGTRVRVEVRPPEQTKAVSPLGAMLLRHAGKLEGLPEDLAERHDHYLYGTPKR